MKTTNRRIELEKEIELAVRKAQVLPLRTAIQAQKGGVVALFVTPIALGNANPMQDGILAVLPFQPYRTHAMNLLFSNLAVRYSAINESLFKTISENTLAPVNVLKLSTDYSQIEKS